MAYITMSAKADIPKTRFADERARVITVGRDQMQADNRPKPEVYADLCHGDLVFFDRGIIEPVQEDDGNETRVRKEVVNMGLVFVVSATNGVPTIHYIEHGTFIGPDISQNILDPATFYENTRNVVFIGIILDKVVHRDLILAASGGREINTPSSIWYSPWHEGSYHFLHSGRFRRQNITISPTTDDSALNDLDIEGNIALVANDNLPIQV